MVPSYLGMVTAAGRLFYISDEAPMTVSGIPDRWYVTARDAFNGKFLWKREMSEFGPSVWSYYTESHHARFNHPINIRERLVADGDRVYVTLGFNAPLTVLDAATGEIVKELDGTDNTDEVVFHDGTLYLSVNEGPVKAWDGKGHDPNPTEKTDVPGKHVLAVDPISGKIKWRSGQLTGLAAGIDRLGAYHHQTGHANLRRQI